MDIPELLDEMQSSIDSVQEQLNEAETQASYAESSACEAYGYASTAENEASNARCAVDEANSMLRILVEEFDRLKELIEPLLNETDAEAVRENPAHSDLQRDMNKWKEKVLHVHKDSPKATIQQIASHLGIGEFLVSRILENESASKAA